MGRVMNRTGPKKHIVSEVLPDSIAEEMGIAAGDTLISVDGQEIRDILDYRFFMADDYVEVLLADGEGEEYLLEIEKEPYEDIGLVFENALMDEYRSCCNGCIFCFIDQMPPGMRRTLYFKDDDSRLSFLQGNYVTLTNMKDEDIERICALHMEPVNVSVHTTNPELRVRMLRNKNAGKVLGRLADLREHGILMNGQVVLCRGYNDGEELDRTIGDLAAYIPEMQSLSVVPVGLTKYRENLTPLEPFGPEDARRVIAQIEAWQEKLFRKHGTHFVHASDEWYLTAGLPLPEAERYDGYPQIENGVGMMRSFLDEVDGAALSAGDGDCLPGKNLFLTGELAAPFIREAMEKVRRRIPRLQAEVLAVRNDFFGPRITVTGLVTGGDLVMQAGRYMKEHGGDYDRVFIPCDMLRADEDVFLDDVTVDGAAEALGLPVLVLREGGDAFVDALCGRLDRALQDKKGRGYGYEQTDRGDRGTA